MPVNNNNASTYDAQKVQALRDIVQGLRQLAVQMQAVSSALQRMEQKSKR